MSEDNQATQEKPRIPGWAWIFVVGCVLIPVVKLGGAFPGALGGGGAFGCVAIARDPTKPVATRVIFCAMVTGVCWSMIVLPAILYAIVRGPTAQ